MAVVCMHVRAAFARKLLGSVRHPAENIMSCGEKIIWLASSRDIHHAWRHMGAPQADLARQQFALARVTPTASSEGAVGVNDAVAGDGHRDGIGVNRLPHRTYGTRSSESQRQFGVRQGGTDWNAPQKFPHSALESRAMQSQRQFVATAGVFHQ